MKRMNGVDILSINIYFKFKRTCVLILTGFSCAKLSESIIDVKYKILLKMIFYCIKCKSKCLVILDTINLNCSNMLKIITHNGRLNFIQIKCGINVLRFFQFNFNIFRFIDVVDDECIFFKIELNYY